MSTRLEHLPGWSEKALQGLAFWIGHRHSLYPNYPLGESALIAEVCNLIFSHLESGQVLLCERQYSQLMPKGKWPSNLGLKSRADLVITNGLTYTQTKQQQSLIDYTSAVIEVKRAFAPQAQINQDLKRLATFKHTNPHQRAFLFIIAEARRPKRFVTPEGKAISGKHNIPESNAHYNVRRVCKAAATFSQRGPRSAHYACVIEIFIDK